MSEVYDGTAAVPPQLKVSDVAGPHGIALVRAWPNGQTDQGWGLIGKGGAPGFMQRYRRGEFNERRILYGYVRNKWNFAFIMRAMQLVCIDIDGKNGGLEHAKRLGALPMTMAETSKSGDGYHLFYRTDEVWDDQYGYAILNDRIGIEQGVDVRVTGCVYHHSQQRWNSRLPVMLPTHLFTLLKHREQLVDATHARIVKVLDSQDDMEILMMQDQLISDLDKPIDQGKRNQTLFAIGTQLYQAEVENWETLIRDKANNVGLDRDETDKLISNIPKYGVPVTP
jgi:hypothetical protein